jgi:hypothetical protein
VASMNFAVEARFARKEHGVDTPDQPDGPVVKLRGQGPRAEADAAHGLPACPPEAAVYETVCSGSDGGR